MSHLHSEDELGSNMHKKDFQTTSIIPLCEESINRAMMEFKTSFMNRMTDEYISQIIGTKDAYKESIKTLTETLTRKYMEGQLMAEKILESQSDCVLQNKCIEEKQEELLEQVAKLKRNKEQNVEQVKIIQSLKEEFNGKRAHIFANKRAIKDRLKELEKSAALFTERLGLEIRKLHGEKLQFVFRYINPKAPHQPYTFILCINEGGQYEVLSCDPPLECISELQQKVQETNNFSAFLANFRKAFTVLACNEKEI
ncbi:kinetochore protein Spc25 isoform X1 [Microcaecilia unicolor]|uniref:Kinetochore protein SPC25 n=1 Tax=Microcaecilia unicolor TaxID=1415580 RepID=A0A6P7Z0M3_9AMPH|nr:kinetochore protein Spc25 isoform X1 [Microcaecilia unicolor]XP_030070774.1 kinetochore protein Spc25 isoform X1 [Microcaecilia unicolor]